MSNRARCFCGAKANAIHKDAYGLNRFMCQKCADELTAIDRPILDTVLEKEASGMVPENKSEILNPGITNLSDKRGKK